MVKNLPANAGGGVVQLHSCVQFFATPWTAAHQASLSFTISWSLLKLVSIESVMPSNHLILCHPLLLLPSVFPSIRVFSNESALRIRWPSITASASASVLPMNIQCLFPLGLTGLLSLESNCRGHGFDPWSRKIPSASGQLSPCATTTEAHTP